MRKIFDLISDLATSDPRLLMALGIIAVIVVAGLVLAKVTRAKRMKAGAKFVRRRD